MVRTERVRVPGPLRAQPAESQAFKSIWPIDALRWTCLAPVRLPDPTGNFLSVWSAASKTAPDKSAHLVSPPNSRSRHHRAKRAGTRHLVVVARGRREALHQPPLCGRDLPRASRRGGRLVDARCRQLGRDGFRYGSLAVNEGIKLSIVVVVIVVIHFG